MITLKAFDIESFINMFSVIFVDLKDYLDKFSDCVDEKGKPIPMCEKLSIAEIKDRLSKVKSDTFYISDTNDSQLDRLVAYINNMATFYKTTENQGTISQEACFTDLYGYNNVGYDDFMIKCFMMYYNRFDTSKELCKKLKELSNKIIILQNDKDAFYQDQEIELIRKYKLPYRSVDVQRIFGLNAATKTTDKDTGETSKFGKSLKQTSINLKWYQLLDFTLPPINQKEYEAYWAHKPMYKRLSIEELNKLCGDDFDRYVLADYIEPMLKYNINDVFIVCEMVRLKPDEIRLRYSLSSAFNIDFLSSSRANIADKLVTRFYSKMSGLHESQFKYKRTQRTKLSFKKVIFPHIKFKTKELQDLLEEMKTVVITSTNKDAFSRNIEFYGTTYTIATGGIHTVDNPAIFKSNDDVVYLHHDYASYYPSIISSYSVYPEHLNKGVFVKMVTYLKNTRVKAKHTKDEVEMLMTGVPNKLTAEALKIVINAIYGKLGSDTFFLFDNIAKLQVTINGQLMTMTLVEELELNGIHVISANTDGIIICMTRDKMPLYKEITDRWNAENKMGADFEEYKMLVARDINNYFDIQVDDSVEFKGAFNPKMYLKELTKGYDMPIVPLAVFNYFTKNIPVMDTLRNHKDILDFCKTQNVGRQFNVVYDTVVNGEITSVTTQRHNRFYVSTKGVRLQKENKHTSQRYSLVKQKVNILNELDDKPIEERNIDYKYYYDEAYKIIDPIMLNISTKRKANGRFKSGKVLIKKYSHEYNSLFDNDL